jgi:hypothetical protein
MLQVWFSIGRTEARLGGEHEAKQRKKARRQEEIVVNLHGTYDEDGLADSGRLSEERQGTRRDDVSQ